MIERLVSFIIRLFIFFIPISSVSLFRSIHAMVPGTSVLGNAGARGGWMADVGAVPSRLLALGLGKIEVIMLFGKGRKKLRLFVFWLDHNCSKLN